MADTHLGAAPVGGLAAERLRTVTIAVYVLYLLAVPTVFTTALIGAVIAYLKKDEAHETPFESHLANAIDVFWVTLVVGIVATPLWYLFYLGALIHTGLLVWALYRTVKGLMLAIEWQPYG
jgi:uncharacterized membrane protein